MKKLLIAILIVSVSISTIFARTSITSAQLAAKVSMKLHLTDDQAVQLTQIYQHCESVIKTTNASNLPTHQKQQIDLAQLQKSDSEVKALIGPEKYKKYRHLGNKRLEGLNK